MKPFGQPSDSSPVTEALRKIGHPDQIIEDLENRVAELQHDLARCRRAHAEPILHVDPQPVYQESTDDCLRAAICTITGLDPALFADYTVKDWPAYWKARLAALNVGLLDANPTYLAALFPGFWIALPPSLHDDGGHAVVMRGGGLFHDPGRREPNYDQAKIDAWLPTNGPAMVPVLLGWNRWRK